MKICVINPNSSSSMTAHIRRALEKIKHPDTELAVVNPAGGPESIESEVDRIETIPGTLDLVRKANTEGFHAIVLACFSDPGIGAAREISSIPIFGIEATTLHVAAMLGHKFSPVTAFPRHIPTRELHARVLGLRDSYASTGVTHLTVLQMDTDEALARKRVLSAARQAIQEDGAEVIVLGCAGLAGYAEQIEAELGVVVIDPTAVAFKVAETMAGVGLGLNKIARGQSIAGENCRDTPTGQKTDPNMEAISTKRFLVINPAAGAKTTDRLRRELNRIKRPTTELTVVNPKRGPVTIESEFEDALAAPPTLELVRQGNGGTYDAIVLAGFCNSSLDASKEISTLPVLGFGETGLRVAAMLGHSFSIVTSLPSRVPMHTKHVRRLGLSDALLSIETIDMSTLEMDANPEEAKRRLGKTVAGAIGQGRIGTIVLGSATLAEYAQDIEHKPGIIVLDPAAVTFKLAEAFVDLGLRHSKIGRYALPDR